MAVRVRLRAVHGVALVLGLAPFVKLAEWGLTPGPKTVRADSARAGSILFRRDWTAGDRLTGGDGLGPVFNARSCVECHFQGGAGGGGTVDKNVTVYGLLAPKPGDPRPPIGVIHRHSVSDEFQETMAQVDPTLPSKPWMPLEQVNARNLSGTASAAAALITQRNTPALFGDGIIDAVTDSTIIAHQREHSSAARLVGLNGALDPNVRGRVARLVDGRIGRFGWKGEFATLGDFVRAACANELGLSNPSRPQAISLASPAHMPKSARPDLTDAQCELMADYVRALPAPRSVVPVSSRSSVELGERAFAKVGCADCHTPDLGSASGLYSDLLLHEMGVELASSTGYYGAPPPSPGDLPPGTLPFGAVAQSALEWKTPPLWGVADSGPYMHDGRSKTLEDAIKAHGGEAVGSASRFDELPPAERQGLLDFLGTLRAPAIEQIAALDLGTTN
ncbi:di-heme oxidoredictase family protein [Isosphaeraceae bacterium EP7]